MAADPIIEKWNTDGGIVWSARRPHIRHYPVGFGRSKEEALADLHRQENNKTGPSKG